MGERQAGQGTVLHGESREMIDDFDQPGQDQVERVAKEDHVRIVGDEAARRAQVDDSRRLGADVPVGVDVRHDVVPQLSLVNGHRVEVDIVHLRPELLDLRLRNGEPQLRLRLRQRHP